MAAGAFAVLLAALSGCGSGDAEAGAESREVRTVTVFAAASLTEVFNRLGTEFAKDRPDVVVRFNFGSSATLAQQIVQGAPADVFAAAAPEPMAKVPSAAGYPKTFARNRLAIAVPPDNPAGVRKLADLARPKVKVALCAEQAPCGAAAAKALAKAGVRVKPVTLERDVKAALTKVRMGEVDAALVYRTDVRAAGDAVRGIDFRAADAAVNDYPIAVAEQARQPELAVEFVNFVLSPNGRKALTEAGFETP
ncbi:molybdate ABC transporter substrate-binding protein [Thermostaphylospora chromogena]|uniref:molybdate ABC transporter substrate-binding protein n=1 Tax=Thermostaphylospora chromogena TaxID=35622 RepID=UPI001F61EE17|nr:molybdate ABC transporter substrate-binding protein [Thermostaphylospora chromogena]